MDEHPALQEQYAGWLEQRDFEQVLRGDELRSYYSHSFFKVSSVEQAGAGDEQVEYGYYFSFPDGLFYSWSLQPYTDQEKNILDRFRNIISLTFRRYLDLQKAEAQAREAQIEAALEKVRSRTLAMQHSDELSETASVMFRQLIILGIAPNRLYIILFNEHSPDMEAWVTDEDGSRVSVGFRGNRHRSKTLNKMYEGWAAQRKSLVLDMQGDELQEYLHYLHDELKVPFKGGMEQKRRLQHLAYFSKGLIGMASPEPQPIDTLQLLERFAAVFNLTFTRFNDLKVAEAHAHQADLDLLAIKEAKQRAEEALVELKATQKQLIQSEKMASLGELTAGIAHEIQNPLNFVNNFSEVSKELIEELKESLEKGDMEDAMDMMADLVQNLAKINEHGKRADSIVKGMLQHSRAGSGQKELTDINAMADECLRLAFHGLRAKDKTFNANFELLTDPQIGKLELMAQDMGRVLLNLVNNAFYAVNDRSKRGEAGYKPMVRVSTEKEDKGVVIRVEDNGDGIPDAIKDKIFQPFFTTKPTGQGTGLGLSLAYDIVKAHDGELAVESKEGQGTSFIIQLPNQ
jgi:signal transduction histidine kinase